MRRDSLRLARPLLLFCVVPFRSCSLPSVGRVREGGGSRVDARHFIVPPPRPSPPRGGRKSEVVRVRRCVITVRPPHPRPLPRGRGRGDKGKPVIGNVCCSARELGTQFRGQREKRHLARPRFRLHAARDDALQNLAPAAQIPIRDPARQFEHPRVEQRFAVNQRRDRLDRAPRRKRRRETDTKADRQLVAATERHLHALPRPNHLAQFVRDEILKDRRERPVEDDLGQQPIFPGRDLPRQQIGRQLGFRKQTGLAGIGHSGGVISRGR